MFKQSCATALALLLLMGLAACNSEQDSDAADMSTTAPDETKPETARPNILLIVADDLGYSDISPYGAEINTPNLASLAEEGIKFTQFYAAPTCSPTRAMLMSGVDSHLSGLGTMAERMTPELAGKPGYEGHLNQRVAALPEVLRGAGYHTYMTGKWHLGKDEHSNPRARGFERSFALLDGAAFHLNNLSHQDPAKGHPQFADYAEDGESVNQLPDDFYSTRDFTEKLIEYIDSKPQDGQPFFAYLAYTAPHWPLQTPASSRDKYSGVYDEGYDIWYERRLASMRQAGVVEANAKAFPRSPEARPWSELTEAEKQYSARRMELQAAMIDDMDEYIGKLINYLKSTGQYDNTLIVFISDNGVEGRDVSEIRVIGDWPSRCCDNSLENIGAEDSYIWLGPNWGRVSSGPLRLWKGSTAEGGIRVPAIIHYPGYIEGSRISDALVTVRDLMPTFLELAGVDLPVEIPERDLLPIQGKSMRPLLKGDANQVHPEDATFGWELSGRKALRQGDWKLLWDSQPFGVDRWALYNLAEDPGETRDLSETLVEKFNEMKAYWDEYQQANNVIPQK